MKIEAGILHEVSPDIEAVLAADTGLLERWNKLTPIQRNEWICWVTIVKKSETRIAHVQRLISDIKEGKKQPCCWPGCPHRRAKAKKWFNNKHDDSRSI